ncbi:hypothetical protein C8F04DRAFT_1330313 [Mycena alexandri]|uniref:Uncharacterized protein n=1 Tax=Mycena alexandri TaxID=1745969 RepID=A0AAD6RYT3_9AGAR|nr:hypothetical protein C8F04DRAFT_1330313 [Mycena alexandri]
MSTTTVTFLQARVKARQQVAAALPDDHSKAKAGDDLVKNLNSPEVKKQAYESVKTLAQTIRNIRGGFISVADALVAFDAKNFRDKDNNVLSLSKEWSPLIKEFDVTLQFSLEQATDAVVLMKSLSFHSSTVTDLLGAVTEADGKDLALELNQFMKQLGAKETGALEMKNRFQQLADDVILFNAKIDVALEKAEAKINTDLESAKARLSALEKELESWNQKVEFWRNDGGIDGGIGKLFLLYNPVGALTGVLNPVGALTGLLNPSANAFSHEHENKKKAECEHNIAVVNQEIKDLLARDQELGPFRTRLAESKEVVTSVQAQILIIVGIWTTINLDIHALDQALLAQLGDNPVITKFFLKKLAVAKEIYAHLTLLLETYIEQTNTTNVDSERQGRLEYPQGYPKGGHVSIPGHHGGAHGDGGSYDAGHGHGGSYDTGHGHGGSQAVWLDDGAHGHGGSYNAGHAHGGSQAVWLDDGAHGHGGSYNAGHAHGGSQAVWLDDGAHGHGSSYNAGHGHGGSYAAGHSGGYYPGGRARGGGYKSRR